MTRREWLQTLASAAAAVPLLAASDPAKPLFFTADEFTLLDTLTELIIPADDHSPGAHAAGVAPYIDRVTAQAFPGPEKDSWTTGLKKIDERAQQSHAATFIALDKSKQVALLTEMSTAHDPFFGQLKETTAFAYYSSSIGIHQEMTYLGNVILQEFVGYSVT